MRAEPATDKQPPTAGDADPYPTPLQENIIATLAIDDEYGRVLAERVRPELFESKAGLQTVVERIIKYRQEQGKAPGTAHTCDLFPEIEEPHNRLGKTFQRIWEGIIVLVDQPSFNPKFAVDSLAEFHDQQTAKGAIVDAANRLLRGDARAMSDVREILRTITDGDRSAVSDLRLVPSTEFDERPLEWYWPPFFPWGVVSILAGTKGRGKTTTIIDIAADLSTGERPRDTILLTKEEANPARLREMMKSANGDPARLLFVGGQGIAGTEHRPPSRLTGRDIEAIGRMVDQRHTEGNKVGLIGIEPLNSFVDPMKANNDAGIRETMDPLSMLAARHGLLVIISAHMTKNREVPILDRIMGSVGVVNASRSVNVLIDDKDDPNGRRLMINLVANDADPEDDNAIGYTMRTKQGVRVIEWEEDKFHLSPDELDAMTMQRGEPGRPRKQDRAKELLREWLAKGPLEQGEITKLASKAGVSMETVKRVKEEVGVRSRRHGDKWRWSLTR